MTFRPIMPDDNVHLARIIRATLREHGADKPGTVYYDDSTDHLFELFQKELAFYYVVEEDAKILGGCGIYPTKGLPDGRLELVKMYLDRSARGRRIAPLLLNLCIEKAISFGSKELYIETMEELSKAISLYESFGFKYLNSPSGDSCHTDCNIWMLKKIQ